VHDYLDLYSSPNTFGDQINKNKMSRTFACMGQRIILYDIKMLFQEMGCGVRTGLILG
jgi:hypothetical protein